MHHPPTSTRLPTRVVAPLLTVAAALCLVGCGGLPERRPTPFVAQWQCVNTLETACGDMVRLTDTGGEVRRQFVTGSRPVTLRFEPGDAVLDAVYTALRDARVQDLRPGTVRVTTSDCHDWLDLTLGDRELNLRYNGRGPQLLPEADYWNAVDALIHLGRVWPRRPVMVRLTVADVLPDGAWIDVGRLRHFQWHPIGLSGERRVVDLLLDCYDAQRMPPCMGPIDLRLHRPDQSAAVATIRLDPADAISHDVRLAIVDGAWQFTTE